jgi:uncharacterized YccA/Bax inhibitor family protein
MESRNPVLNREFATFRNGAPTAETLQGMYDAPGSDGRVMTIDDVVVKTGMLFLILVVAAIGGWKLYDSTPAIVFISAIAAFVLGMFVAFKRSASPVLIMGYALLEGLFLGGISNFYQNSKYINPNQGNLVLQAVIGTFVAFGVMLLLYKSGRLRATPQFTKVMTIALVSYLGIAVVSLISALFGVGGGWGFYGVGPMGLLLCALGVGLAAFTLVLDFDAIEKGINAGLPERESWRGAFGLMVTLVWLYLELLRLLALLQGGGGRR